jgi:hypothetical protein
MSAPTVEAALPASPRRSSDEALALALQSAFNSPRGSRRGAALAPVSPPAAKRGGWRPGDTSAKRRKTQYNDGATPSLPPRAASPPPATAAAAADTTDSSDGEAGAAGDAGAGPASPAAVQLPGAAAPPVARPPRLPEYAPGALVWAQVPGWLCWWPGRMCVLPGSALTCQCMHAPLAPLAPACVHAPLAHACTHAPLADPAHSDARLRRTAGC